MQTMNHTARTFDAFVAAMDEADAEYAHGFLEDTTFSAPSVYEERHYDALYRDALESGRAPFKPRRQSSRMAADMMTDGCYDPAAIDELIHDEDDIRVALCGTRIDNMEDYFG